MDFFLCGLKRMFSLRSLSCKAFNDISQPSFPVFNCIKLPSCPFLLLRMLLFQANSSCCLTLYLRAFIFVLLCVWNLLSIPSTCWHPTSCSRSVSGAISSPSHPCGKWPLSLGCWRHFIWCEAVVPRCLLFPHILALTPPLDLTSWRQGSRLFHILVLLMA